MCLKIAIDKLRCIVIRRHAETLFCTAQGVKQAVGFKWAGEGCIKLAETARPGRADCPSAAECYASFGLASRLAGGHLGVPDAGSREQEAAGRRLAFAFKGTARREKI